jgi:hypothetical protein
MPASAESGVPAAPESFTMDVSARLAEIEKFAAYGKEFLDFVKVRKFRNPKTGNMVRFVSLSASEQAAVFKKWKAHQKAPPETPEQGKKYLADFEATVQTMRADGPDAVIAFIRALGLAGQTGSKDRAGILARIREQHAQREGEFADLPPREKAAGMHSVIKMGFSKEFTEAVKSMKFVHPKTDNSVRFVSLPADEQKRIHDYWEKHEHAFAPGQKGWVRHTQQIDTLIRTWANPSFGHKNLRHKFWEWSSGDKNISPEDLAYLRRAGIARKDGGGMTEFGRRVKRYLAQYERPGTGVEDINKKAYSEEFMRWAESMSFTNPDTGNKVKFVSLPADRQAQIHAQYEAGRESGRQKTQEQAAQKAQTPKKPKRPTFPQARDSAYGALEEAGWSVKKGLKVPKAEREIDGERVILHFHPQAVWMEVKNKTPARSLHTDIRDVDPKKWAESLAGEARSMLELEERLNKTANMRTSSIKPRKYSATQQGFHVSPKEKSRASKDGVTIIVRPQDKGGHGVFAVDTAGHHVGINWYEVDGKQEIPNAVRLLNRDLDKFHGRGDQMSERSRHRVAQSEDKMAIRLRLGPQQIREFREDVKGKRFRHPETGNQVLFVSLPASEQHRIYKEWQQKEKEGQEAYYGAVGEQEALHRRELKRRIERGDSKGTPAVHPSEEGHRVKKISEIKKWDRVSIVGPKGERQDFIASVRGKGELLLKPVSRGVSPRLLRHKELANLEVYLLPAKNKPVPPAESPKPNGLTPEDNKMTKQDRLKKARTRWAQMSPQDRDAMRSAFADMFQGPVVHAQPLPGQGQHPGEEPPEPPPPAEVKRMLADRMRDVARSLMMAGMKPPRQQMMEIAKALDLLLEQLNLLADQPGRDALRRRILLNIRQRISSGKA